MSTQSVPLKRLKVVMFTQSVPLNLLAVVRSVAIFVPLCLFPGGLTRIDRVDVFVLPVTFVALITKVNVPVAIGVPVIAPLEVFKLSPVGSVPENKE
jgi:hypothetical protein